METKSRYEVIAELENKKRQLIEEKSTFADLVYQKEKEIKNYERRIEDLKEDLIKFKSGIEDRKQVITELVKSTEESIKRMTEMNQTQGK